MSKIFVDTIFLSNNFFHPIFLILDFRDIFFLKYFVPSCCHTRLHLGCSAKVKTWQVPTGKMEPQSGIIFCLKWLAGRPAGHPTTPMLKQKERPHIVLVCPHLLCLSPPIMSVPTYMSVPPYHIYPHLFCLSPPIMSVLTYYVCPHLLCLSQPLCLSPPFMSVPTYYVCPHPYFFLLTSPS